MPCQESVNPSRETLFLSPEITDVAKIADFQSFFIVSQTDMDEHTKSAGKKLRNLLSVFLEYLILLYLTTWTLQSENRLRNPRRYKPNSLVAPL